MDPKIMLRDALYASFSGKQDDALTILGRIRESVPIDMYPDIAIELITIEGICFGYLGDLSTSIKRHQVALALAEKYATKEVKHFVVAWYALAQYNSGDLVSSVKSVASVVGGEIVDRPDVRFRTCSLIAMLTAYSDLPCAQEWFDIALSTARTSGHHSMFSVALYNYAALRVSSLALGGMGNIDNQIHANASEALLLLQSAKNYDSLTGNSNQGALHDLLIAQCLSSMGRCSEAIEYFERFLASDCQTRSSERVKAMLELRVCKDRVGSKISENNSLIDMLSTFIEPDDLAIAHHHLSFIYNNMKEFEHEAERHRVLAFEYLKEAKRLREITRLAIIDAGLEDITAARKWVGG